MLKKKIARFIIYIKEYLISLSDRSQPSINSTSNNFLLVRLDAWGDYIMFRNFIEFLKKSEPYQLKQFYLLGNIAWKQFAETLDAAYIDKFIWVDVKQFMHDKKYRNQLIKELNEIGFETIFSPTYSRQFGVDSFLHHIHATQKIAIAGDSRNTLNCLLRKSNCFFTQLITIDNSIEFEFTRNIAITKQLISFKAPIKPSLPKLQTYPGLKIPYAVLFIDAADDYRRWPAERFGKVARHLAKKYDTYSVLAGKNKELADAIINCTSGIMIIDLTGHTTLTELSAIIQDTSILVSNDTGAAHIGVAANVKTICVSNGNHYGRFVPYPEHIYSDIRTVFPDKLFKNSNDHQILINTYREGSMLDISEIKSEIVIEEIDKLLK